MRDQRQTDIYTTTLLKQDYAITHSGKNQYDYDICMD